LKGLKKYAPIYVLSASLVLSSFIYSNKAESSSQYVTIEMRNKDLQDVAKIIVDLRNRVARLEGCMKAVRIGTGINC